MDQFGKQVDTVYMNLGIDINNRKKQLGCIIDFLRLEFDILPIRTWLLKNKLKKVIERKIKIFEKKSFMKNCNSKLSFFLLQPKFFI